MTNEQHHPRMTAMEIIEARRRAMRTEPLEACHPVMEFLEDIIYCPSQIEFYFRSDGQVMSLYVRQRHGETTAQLVPCYPNGEYQTDSPWPEIPLSRPYDIEAASRESDEAEEQEIIAPVPRRRVPLSPQPPPRPLRPSAG